MRRFAPRAASILATAALVLTPALADNLPPYLQKMPAFNPAVTSQIPGDVDIPLKEKLEKEKKFAEVQREFDLNAWQMFLALNWPTSAKGEPAKSLTDKGPNLYPHWTLWQESYNIFRTDGKRPTACGPSGNKALVTLAAQPLEDGLSLSRGLAPLSELSGAGQKTLAEAAPSDPRAIRSLAVLSSVGELNAGNLSDIQQAFTGPLIDQNGEFVFYEIMIDPNEVGYLCDNSLYNINGQVAFSKAGKKVAMPFGTSQKNASGSFELKLAWKVLKGPDDPSRFYAYKAKIVDQGPDGKPVVRDVTVGLVGMHIGHKSETSPQWIWATFEQVDNLDVDAVAHPKLQPSFTNPNCPTCAVNQQPTQSANGVYSRTPTQAWRSIPIPGDKLALNAEAQSALKQMGSVWQYYELIDTQWPTSPKTPPTPSSAGVPGAVENKSGGNPTPVFLTNVTMETYFQNTNGPACNAEENATCSAVWQGPKLPPLAANVTIFATESCIGCHSSAGIWSQYDPNNPAKQTQSGQLTADFSWLLSQKASFEGGASPKNALKAALKANAP